MYPIFTSINKDIYANINSSGKGLDPDTNTSLNSSELVPFIRLISGTGNGLIMSSNPNVPVLSNEYSAEFDKDGKLKSLKSSPSLYGNRWASGMLGVDWNQDPVFPIVTPFTQGAGDLVLRPSPLIAGLEVKEGKDQISRQADLRIICFSLSQAEMVQQYLMEPGHSLLIEYGWNTDRGLASLIEVVDGAGNPVSSDRIVNQAAENNLNQQNLHAKRVNSMGDYDSFFGFIVGGSMTAEDDKYVLTIKLRGQPGLPTFLQLHQNINPITDVTEDGKVVKKINKIPSAPPYTQLDIEGNGNYSPLVKQGFRRYAWLFNKLPAVRQTLEVRNNIVEATKNNTSINVPGYWDLINFDYNVSQQILNLNNTNWWDNVKSLFGFEKEFLVDGVSVPPEKLISTNKYIRLQRAIEILNANNGLTSYKVGNKKVKVKIESTGYIGAFPGIFSTKPSKLVIPGDIPNFYNYYLNTDVVDINGILTDQFFDASIYVNYEKSLAPLARVNNVNSFNLMPWNQSYNFGNKTNENATNFQATSTYTEKISFVQYSSDKKGLRPQLIDPNDESKGRYLGQYENDGYYGQLGNLYINFNIFFDAISNSSNKSIREVLIDILNELSSAVNSFWNFQIVEGTDKNGDIILKIIDENWSGKNERSVRKFFHAGEKSVFLESNLSIDVPSEMTNQIILKKASYTSNPNSKSLRTGRNSIFTDAPDLFSAGVDFSTTDTDSDSLKKEKNVLDELKAKKEALQKSLIQKLVKRDNKNFESSVYEYTDANNNLVYTFIYDPFLGTSEYKYNTSNATGAELSSLDAAIKKEEEEQKRSKETNIQSNLSKIDVVPNPVKESLVGAGGELTTNDLRIDNEAGKARFKDNFRIYCCDDTQLFDILKNNAFEKYEKDEIKATSHPLPIKYTFKILGKSGLRRGDVFNVWGIPQKYNDYGFFQITQIEQTIENNNWYTEITGEFRQQTQPKENK